MIGFELKLDIFLECVRKSSNYSGHFSPEITFIE